MKSSARARTSSGPACFHPNPVLRSCMAQPHESDRIGGEESGAGSASADSSRRVPVVAYIAMGSNLGDRAATLDAAVVRIGRIPGTRVLLISRWIRTAPVGIIDQPEFLNGACAVVTELAAQDLLAELLRAESEFGRDRSSVHAGGPRTLDLDLLLYGSSVISERGLDVPHPRMHQRRFVLEPLAQIAPEAIIPILGLTVVQALAALAASEGPDNR